MPAQGRKSPQSGPKKGPFKQSPLPDNTPTLHDILTADAVDLTRTKGPFGLTPYEASKAAGATRTPRSGNRLQVLELMRKVEELGTERAWSSRCDACVKADSRCITGKSKRCSFCIKSHFGCSLAPKRSEPSADDLLSGRPYVSDIPEPPGGWEVGVVHPPNKSGCKHSRSRSRSRTASPSPSPASKRHKRIRFAKHDSTLAQRVKVTKQASAAKAGQPRYARRHEDPPDSSTLTPPNQTNSVPEGLSARPGEDPLIAEAVSSPDSLEDADTLSLSSEEDDGDADPANVTANNPRPVERTRYATLARPKNAAKRRASTTLSPVHTNASQPAPATRLGRTTATASTTVASTNNLPESLSGPTSQTSAIAQSQTSMARREKRNQGFFGKLGNEVSSVSGELTELREELVFATSELVRMGARMAHIESTVDLVMTANASLRTLVHESNARLAEAEKRIRVLERQGSVRNGPNPVLGRLHPSK